MDKDEHESIGRNVIPKNYRLAYEPDFSSFKSRCEEEISVYINEPVDAIRLNSKEIDVLKAEAEANGAKADAVVKALPEREEIELQFKEKLQGEVKIKLDCSVINNDKMYGFYRSSFVSEGKQEYILTTDFEPANARSAFVCIDEPEFKATFDVSLKIPKDMDGISNMPKIEEKIIGEKKEIKFATTPKMSTYLLYAGVGRFDMINSKLGNLTVGVVTTAGKKKYAKSALEFGKKFIQFFQEYFGVDYPLPKIDLIAVPDFAVGAMENWGAITFRESRILIDEKSSAADKAGVAETIAHELAHQWFGDLVTMRWWNDLWLNESFATFMSYKAMEKLFPKWKRDLEYLTYAFDGAFGTDGLKASHPISVNVQSPAEIEEIFDNISYQKGGSVLCMLNSYVGDEAFRKGLNLYLTKHSYGNATKSDLWTSIETASLELGKTLEVSKVMEAWVNKVGYPIVHVFPTKEGFHLSQDRFLFAGETKDRWPIPINYAIKKPGHTSTILMDKDNYEIPYTDDKKTAIKDLWIKLNSGQNGFYRVAYEETLLEKLGKLIKMKKLSAADAWGVENDLFALVRSGVVKTDRYLDFINGFCDRPDYPLSTGIISHLAWLHKINSESAYVKKIADVGLKVGRSLFKKYDWDNKPKDEQTDKLTRAAAIGLLGALEDPKIVKKANSLFDSLIDRGKPINPDILSNVYSIVALSGDETRFEQLRNLYEKTTSVSESMAILSALGKFRNEKLLSKSLEFSKSEKIRLQDSWIIATAATYNPTGGKLLWPWTKNNWKILLDKYAPGTKILHRYIENLRMIKTKEDLQDITEFFSLKENLRTEISTYLKQTLEVININIKYLRRA